MIVLEESFIGFDLKSYYTFRKNILKSSRKGRKGNAEHAKKYISVVFLCVLGFFFAVFA
jgi:hypothetical protein